MAHPGHRDRGDAADGAHAPLSFKRLQVPPDFDEDTPYIEGIYDHARRAVGAALCAMNLALVQHEKAFALMRPPGHHATAGQAMGFCYLNQIALAAVAARARGAQRVAVWDFDAHHGNGTEAILDGREGFLFCSIHQFPGYPGTGTRNSSNCRNYPIAPHTPRADHLAELARSWDAILGYKPDLVLVSAGFDAYVHDPVTAMTLEDRGLRRAGPLAASRPISPSRPCSREATAPSCRNCSTHSSAPGPRDSWRDLPTRLARPRALSPVQPRLPWSMLTHSSPLPPL
jgi:acetoin utilization deacetylase AcuC-like enzyme